MRDLIFGLILVAIILLLSGNLELYSDQICFALEPLDQASWSCWP